MLEILLNLLVFLAHKNEIGGRYVLVTLIQFIKCTIKAERAELEAHHENRALLDTIDNALFLVVLDDVDPQGCFLKIIPVFNPQKR